MRMSELYTMLTRRAIQPHDYPLVLEADRTIYPTASPLTRQVIEQWYKKNPEFGIIYTTHDDSSAPSGSRTDNVVAMCIVVPLNKAGWNALIRGELKESELTEETIFDNARDDCIGLHIYHMERMPSFATITRTNSKGNNNNNSNSNSNSNARDQRRRSESRLGILSLISLEEILTNLRKTNKNLQVIGLSGLCVSISGINLFNNTYNCREREYICAEHILRKPQKQHRHRDDESHRRRQQQQQQPQPELIVVKTESQEEIARRIKEHNYEYQNRCKMLVVYPNEVSIVWVYITARSPAAAALALRCSRM